VEFDRLIADQREGRRADEGRRGPAIHSSSAPVTSLTPLTLSTVQTVTPEESFRTSLYNCPPVSHTSFGVSPRVFSVIVVGFATPAGRIGVGHLRRRGSAREGQQRPPRHRRAVRVDELRLRAPRQRIDRGLGNAREREQHYE
jgi:hypothetical protein